MRSSPLALVVTLLPLALACHNSGDITSAKGVPQKPTNSSTGLNNNVAMPDAHVDPDSGLVAWTDAGVPDGAVSLQEGQCAGETQAAQRVPLDLLLLVDRSSSMVDRAPGGKSKWEMVQTALTSFVQDPKSTGMGIGLQYFPLLVSCSGESDCGFPAGPTTTPACFAEHACLPPSGLITGLPQLCGARREGPCPDGTTCQPLGRCSQSGAACPMIGLPCPGAMAGDLCQATPTTCRDAPTATCNAADYGKLAVPITDLPAGAQSLSLSLARTLPYSGGGTPTDPVVTAGLMQLRARAAAHPERKPILILVTDGLPNSCGANPVQTISDMIAAARMATPSIPTYAIGVFAPEDVVSGTGALGQWATAGGSGMPFLLDATVDLTKQLQDALEQIRGAALPCEFTIPQPMSGMLDYMKVNVHLSSASTGPMEPDLGHVASAQSCDPAKGGWYYDVDPTTGAPTRVILCENTCNRVKVEAGAKIDLRFGCKTIVIQ